MPGTHLSGTAADFQNCVWDLLQPRFFEQLECRCNELKARNRMRCELSVARPCGVGVARAEQAIAAVHRFTQHQGHLQAEATPCRGSAEAAFKVSVDDTDTSASIAYFVKVLSHEKPQSDIDIRKFQSDGAIPNAVEITALMGHSGLGPAVLGSDADAFVQTFVEGKELSPLCEITAKGSDVWLPLAQSVGRIIAGVHSLPFEKESIASPHWTWWTLLPERIQTLPCEHREPLMALYNCIDSWPKERGVGGMRVLSHGDFHLQNVLVLNHSSACDGVRAVVELNVVDLELCGSHYRAFDLAFCFWHWDWKCNGGDGKYPDLAMRKIIVQSYLQEAGFNSSDDELDSLLWEVEFECLRIACWREIGFGKPQGKFTSALGPLLDLLNAIKADLVHSSEMKHDSIEDGLLQYASAAASRSLRVGACGGA